MKLHLGVIEAPEIEPGETTYTVGKKLEETYGIFSMFYNTYEDFIADQIAQDIARFGINVKNGVTPSNPFAETGAEITQKMQDFINTREVETVAGKYGEQGIPTQAALDGVTTRTKQGRKVAKARKGQKYVREATGVRRASFVDSGIFVASMTGWIS